MLNPQPRAGGPQPAVVRVTHRQRRACLSERETRVAQLARHSWSRERVPLLICVSDRRVCYVCHGRLTPTALGARRYVPSNTLHKRTCTRAAGVSPPWFGNRASNTERFLPMSMLACHDYAPRYWWFCSAHLPAKLRCDATRNAHLQERRALARRGSGITPATPSVSLRTGNSRRTAGLRQTLLVA
jgi:hypothetical protein